MQQSSTVQMWHNFVFLCISLNVKNTKFMLIGSQYNFSHINKNSSIDRVVEHKYLGVNIDESL